MEARRHRLWKALSILPPHSRHDLDEENIYEVPAGCSEGAFDEARWSLLVDRLIEITPAIEPHLDSLESALAHRDAHVRAAALRLFGFFSAQLVIGPRLNETIATLSRLVDGNQNSQSLIILEGLLVMMEKVLRGWAPSSLGALFASRRDYYNLPLLFLEHKSKFVSTAALKLLVAMASTLSSSSAVLLPGLAELISSEHDDLKIMASDFFIFLTQSATENGRQFMSISLREELIQELLRSLSTSNNNLRSRLFELLQVLAEVGLLGSVLPHDDALSSLFTSAMMMSNLSGALLSFVGLLAALLPLSSSSPLLVSLHSTLFNTITGRPSDIPHHFSTFRIADLPLRQQIQILLAVLDLLHSALAQGKLWLFSHSNWIDFTLKVLAQYRSGSTPQLLRVSLAAVRVLHTAIPLIASLPLADLVASLALIDVETATRLEIDLLSCRGLLLRLHLAQLSPPQQELLCSRLLTASSSPAWEVRDSALKELSELPPSLLLARSSALIKALEDPHFEVQRRALQILGRIIPLGLSPPPTLPSITRFLTHSESVLRVECLRCCTSLLQAPSLSSFHLQLAQETLGFLAFDADVDVRVAACDLLALALLLPSAALPSAFFQIKTFTTDSNRIVRQRAFMLCLELLTARSSDLDPPLLLERDSHDWSALVAGEEPAAVYDEDDELLPDELQETQTLDCPF